MSVPFIDLRRFEDGFLSRWNERCREISENTRFVGGPDVARFEERLAEACGTSHAVGCANGTDAIQLALRAAGIGRGDRVLLPDATFWATFEAVVNVGATPITVDIDPADQQMSFELFSRAVDETAPAAAILVHLYGWGSARLNDFRSLCRERDIVLVEDGAQAFGASYEGQSIYADCQMATISFYPAKVLGSCGDAGAVVTNDADLAERIRRLGNHGRFTHYEHDLVGWNSRMAGFDGAYLDLCLDFMDERLATRRRAAALYRDRLKAMGFQTSGPPEGYVENGYVNVTLIEPEARPAVHETLREQGIGFGTIYPTAVSKQPGVEGILEKAYGGENSDHLARSVLNLPLFAYITDDEIDEVLSAMSALKGPSDGSP